MSGEQTGKCDMSTDERVSHTPGPWTIAGRETALEVVEARRSRMRVCFLTSDGPCEANAHLIAAAPDLLAALKAVVAISDRKHDAWDAAWAAIDKAEGRSNG